MANDLLPTLSYPKPQVVPSASASPTPMTVADLGRVMARHRWWSVCAGLVVAVTVLLATFRQTPLYEAGSQLVIERGRKSMDFGQVDDSRVEYSLLNTQRDILLSRPVLQKAVADAGLESNPSYANAVDPIELLHRRIEVTTSRDSWVIVVSLRDESPQRAEKALAALLDAFLVQQDKAQQSRSSGALSFLSRQVADARNRLDEARKREQEFRSTTGILSTDPDRNHLAQALESLTRHRTDIERLQAEVEARRDAVDRAMRISEDQRIQIHELLKLNAISGNPVVMKQQQDLYDLLPQRVVLAQKYKEKHPRMIELNERIQALERQLAEAVTAARATITTQVEQVLNEARSIEARTADIQKQMATYRDGLINLAILTDESSGREKTYRDLLSRLNEEEVTSRLDARQLAITAKPYASTKPVNIKKPLFVAAAALAGAVAAVVAALMRETLDRHVRGSAGLQEATGLPLIGSIPHVAGLNHLLGTPGASLPMHLLESYRSLRTVLHLARDGRLERVMVVTSGDAGDGKSSVSALLGMSIASTGKRVLLIDADLRRPSLHLKLGKPVDHGFSELLSGAPDIRPQGTATPNLDFLPAGMKPANPAELLHSPVLDAFLGTITASYDCVIIDTPPLGLVTDALVLGERAAGILLVVRDGRTTRPALAEALAKLEPLRGRMLGVVFNAERDRRGGYAYQYKYYDQVKATA